MRDVLMVIAVFVGGLFAGTLFRPKRPRSKRPVFEFEKEILRFPTAVMVRVEVPGKAPFWRIAPWVRDGRDAEFSIRDLDQLYFALAQQLGVIEKLRQEAEKSGEGTRT